MKKHLFFLVLVAFLLIFKTNAQVTVLNENFEIPGLPAGWSLIDANNDGQTWAHNSTFYVDGHNSDGCYYSSSMGGVTPDDWLVTQAINLGTSSTLTFWRMFGFRKYDHYGVYVSTTSASDPSAFTLLYEETLVNEEDYIWLQKTVDLSNYDNSTVYIAFRHFNCTNQLAIILDDILVTSTMASPVITVEPSTLQFVDVPAGTPSAVQLVTINAFNLTDMITVSVNTPFEVSTDSVNYTQTLTMMDVDHNLYVRYYPDAAGEDSDMVILTSGTASTSVNLFGNCIACEAPTSLASYSVTGSSAIVNWTGNADNYNIYYKTASDADWTVIENVYPDTMGYTIDNLSSSTTYTWYVASVCGDGSTVSSLEEGTFTTGCDAYTIPFAQPFDVYSQLPQCWNRYKGMATNVFAGGGLSSTTSGWNFYNTNVFGAYHARLNICNTNCNDWLVTPPIDLSGLTNPTLTFELALTAWNSSGAITPNNQSDDKFMVIISTDDGATWSAANATVWSNDGTGTYVYDQISTTGQEVSISLADYVNQTVRIAFYGESTLTNGDNDLHIDNVMVNAATACANPSNLTTAVSGNAVTLSWTENGSATAWNIEYGPTGYQQGSGAATLVQAATNPFTINNLSVGTYDFYVQADCEDEQSIWVGPVTATPGSYNMASSGSDTVTTCDLIIFDNGGPTVNYTEGCNSTLVIFPEVNGNSIAVSGNFHTENCCDYLRFYDGVGTNGNMLGQYQGTGTIPTLVASSGPMTIVFFSDNGLQYEGFELNVSCVSCTPPDNLTASNIDYASAELSWTGSSSLYVVEYKAEDDTVWVTETTTDTSLVLTNLHDYSVYTVNIYSNCNGELSPATTITFSTEMIPTEIPFSTDFSNPTEWGFNNGSCGNYWTIRAVSDTANALFVTTNGNTPGYNNSGSVSVVSAEKLFTIGTTAEVEISFDVQIGGEDMFDYLKVFFAPVDETYPATTSLTTSYASETFNTYAVNFTDYLQYSDYTSLPYKFNLTNGNTVHVTVAMPNPNTNPDANSTAKLVFLWRNDHTGGVQPGAIVHHVSIAPLACPAPTNLSVMNITGSSADISWNATGNEENWILEYRASGDSLWTSVPVSGTPAYSLSGLTVGIPYQLRVQTVCGVDVQSLWITTMFTTFCDAVTTFPFTEDFEHNGLMPECWSQEYVYNNIDWAFQAGGHNNGIIHNAHSGSYNAFFFAESNDGLTTRLVTPILDLSSMTEAYVTLWYAQPVWGNNQDQLCVYYRSNPNDQWQLLTRYYGNINTWTKDSLNLPDLSATYQLAFVGIANYGYGIVLDEITIDGSNTPPVVIDPTVLTIAASNVTQTTATLNASINNPDDVTITAKGFEWKPTTGGSYTQIAGTGTGTTFSASLTNLAANTGYTFKAFITYEGGTVYGEEMNFSTLVDAINDVNLASSISLMPNPADNYIELSINSNVDVKEAVVFNAFGQMIQTVQLNNNHARIDLSNVASGMYFVRVNNEGVSATKKFIRK